MRITQEDGNYDEYGRKKKSQTTTKTDGESKGYV